MFRPLEVISMSAPTVHSLDGNSLALEVGPDAIITRAPFIAPFPYAEFALAPQSDVSCCPVVE